MASGRPSPVSEEIKDAVKQAIACGYRHIDTAYVYGVEASIGAALREAFAEGVVRREELFVTTKLFNSHHAKEDGRARERAEVQRLSAHVVSVGRPERAREPLVLVAPLVLDTAEDLATVPLEDPPRHGGLGI